MGIIEQMILKYEMNSQSDVLNALKEISQEIVLLALYRSDFFSKAAFYGGTALRIFYGLNRFSEDLDFSLIEKNTSFRIEDYFLHIKNEFKSLGINVELSKKTKKVPGNNIAVAFLKSNTSIHTLNFEHKDLQKASGGIYNGRNFKIKLEVDTSPPLKFETEVKTLLNPITFNIVSMTLPNLYAGKMHAVLFRKWKNRVKGRDWFDFEWYVKTGVALNLDHLQQRMIESNDLTADQELNQEVFKQLMHHKIDHLNINLAKEELSPFIKDVSLLDFWSKDYFKLLVEKVKFDE
jgi:hypothetical protein